MDTEKFIDLISVLEGVKPTEFDLSHWQNECGTVACAVGHYILKRPAAGIVLNDGVPIVRGDSFKWGFSAASVEFGITWREAVQLFDVDSYPADACSLGHVLARLRNLLFDLTGIDYHASKASAPSLPQLETAQ